MSNERTLDVVILGGGISGLLLDRHLRSAVPGIRTAIADPGPLPVDPTCSKVGESATEAASWYLGERLGLQEHLQADQVRKLGLRFFLRGAEGERFEARPEFGVMTTTSGPVTSEGVDPPTWQLHRGRLEHHLLDEAMRAGVRVASGVEPRVTLGSPHRIELGGEVWHARWAIDASGGKGALPMPPDDDQRLPHRAQAGWFWVRGGIDVDAFSEDPAFRARLGADLRWRSTNHLVGRGYWVWLIRLGDGSTSVGIVSDPAIHPPTAFAGPDAAMAWLAAHEPECAEAVGAAGGPERYAFRSWHSHARRTLVSRERWAVTGDTAAFLDPLYSSGLDLVVIGNELLVPAVADDLAGREIDRRCRRASTLFDQIAGQYLGLYREVFATMGHPRAMMAKIVWDLGTYFGFLAPLVRSGNLADDAFMARVAPIGRGVAELQRRVAGCIAAWGQTPPARVEGWVDQGRLGVLAAMVDRLKHRGEPMQVLQANLELLEQLAVGIWQRSCDERGLDRPPGAVNPYAVGPEPEAWAQDGLVRGARPVIVEPWVADTVRTAGL